MICVEKSTEVRPFADQLREPSEQLVPKHRVETAGRLVEQQEFRSMRQRERERELHPRAARQRADGCLRRHAELGDEAAEQVAIPRRINGATIAATRSTDR